jgi:hypothetical protein
MLWPVLWQVNQGSRAQGPSEQANRRNLFSQRDSARVENFYDTSIRIQRVSEV